MFALQVTVEYASRIRRLVQGIKSGHLKPDLVCFTGGRVRDNKVADASAGYVFFRHLSEHQGVSKTVVCARVRLCVCVLYMCTCVYMCVL